MNSIVKNKEKLQNTKKIKDIVKRFSILSLSLIFILMSFTFSFADSNSNILSIEPTIQRGSISNGTIAGDSRIGFDLSPYYNNGDTVTITGSISFDPTNSSRSFSIYDATFSNGSFSQHNSLGNGTYNISNSSNITITYIFDSNYPYFYIQMKSYSDYSINISNIYINAITGSNVKYPFTLQNGYLFVYDCGQSNTTYSFDLSSKSEEYSDIGSIPFPDTNQSYWFSDSLPEIDETTIPSSSATIISWQKGDKTNIFGQSQDMIATISGNSSGRYLYIYNPPVHYKWSGSSNPTASETINYPMIINGVSEDENWYIYDSVARLTDFNQGGSVSGTITGEQVIGSVSSDGGINLITSSGAIYTQNSGGSTDISGANGGSLAENINGLNNTLNDFVNQFIQLLSAPISHIQQLIQSSHQFFDVFSQLFDWLPSELSSVIVSGLIIMVVIGVIKMLL